MTAQDKSRRQANVVAGVTDFCIRGAVASNLHPLSSIASFLLFDAAPGVTVLSRALDAYACNTHLVLSAGAAMSTAGSHDIPRGPRPTVAASPHPRPVGQLSPSGRFCLQTSQMDEPKAGQLAHFILYSANE